MWVWIGFVVGRVFRFFFVICCGFWVLVDDDVREFKIEGKLEV